MPNQKQTLSLGSQEQDAILILLLKKKAVQDIQLLHSLSEQTPKHSFPIRIEEQMTQLARKVDAACHKATTRKRFLTGVAAFLLFLLLTFFVLCLGNPKLQASIQDFFFHFQKDYTIWDTTTEHSSTASSETEAASWLKQKPEYLPDGYILTEELESFSSRLSLYENDSHQIFCIGISLADDTNGEIYAFDHTPCIEHQIEQDGLWFTFFEATHPEEGNASFLFYKFPDESGYLYLSGILEWDEFYHVFTEMKP